MKSKNLLLCGASAFAIVAVATPALAQDTMETVVVTGMRASLQSAQSIKQNADKIVDSITAVDIGALPDRSVAEALQRIPGIQITRTDAVADPVRWAGFGNGVFIRGLSWVSALTNGEETFGAVNGRTISFADVSANLMRSVDVYKNPDASMIEGGIGGVVDLNTRKPFDQDGRMIALSGDYTFGSISGRYAPSINALISDRWHTGIGEIGLLLSADYQDLRASNNTVTAGVFDGTATVGGSTVRYPQDEALGNRRLDWKQPRVALDATLQWRPTEALDVTFTYLFSKAEPSSNEHQVAWTIPTDQTSLNGFKYDAQGSFIGGTFNNAATNASDVNNFGSRFSARHNISANYSLAVKYNPTDALEVNFDAQYVDSRSTVYDMSVFEKVKNNQWCYFAANNWSDNCSAAPTSARYYPNAPVINYTSDLSTNTPRLSYTGDVAQLASPSSYIWGAAMDHLENNYAHAWSTKADAKYSFSSRPLDWIKDVRFGFRANLKQAVTRQSGWNWGPLSYQSWQNGWVFGKDGTTPSMVAAIGDVSTVASNAASVYHFKSVFGQALPNVVLPDVNFLKQGDQAVWDTIKKTQAGNAAIGITGMWTALAAQGNCTGVAYKCNQIYNSATPSADSNSGGINNQTENTYAGYAQVDFLNERFLGFDVPVDGNIGVRIVNTQGESGAGYMILPAVGSCDPTKTSNCANINEARAFVGNNGNSLVVATPSVSHNYTDVLPSFNVRFGLSDKLQLRAAFSQGIVRPDFANTQNNTSLRYNFQDSGLFQTGNQGLIGTGGNPSLKPLKANNYDVSLEWFFSNTGSMSFALFHKDLSNYFMSSVVKESYTRNGINETFYLTRYANGDKGKLEGFEFAYQQFYDSLPGAWSGLGLQANYTKLYNSGGHNAIRNISNGNTISNAADTTLPMEGMSDDSANVALLYAKYGIDARLAYNWRSRYLMSASAANLNTPVWQRAYGQLDSSVMYDLTDNYKVGVQASNLLGQTTILQVGGASYHPNYQWVEGERKFSVILRAKW
ncbi:TonB-dependent receptor [Rhizomicrobium palustre]|uniref:TonB-dependent receptor n=1 Tax=Rhizomicrobium palustre TaxID=189966 RepID=A0A846N0W6_9PROT|nr:TonB-dependent receptor [Rhizomicrobium palustre]NIK88882.1 TonB-dependent receptor [Rhizomicrobium palustre]